MHDPSSGTGYFEIKTLNNRWVTARNDVPQKYTLAEGTWQGQVGIDWTDNERHRAEHTWKLTAVGDSKTHFHIQNSQYTDAYIGKSYASTYSYWDNLKNPIMIIEAADTDGTKWTMKLKGLSADYTAFAWATSASGTAGYGYLDFETISYDKAQFTTAQQSRFTFIEKAPTEAPTAAPTEAPTAAATEARL